MVQVTPIMLNRGRFIEFLQIRIREVAVVKFTSGAATFYLMQGGERLQKHHIYGDYNQIYVVWPAGEKWAVRFRWGKGWEEITDSKFSTQNEAFNFAYDHYLKNGG